MELFAGFVLYLLCCCFRRLLWEEGWKRELSVVRAWLSSGNNALLVRGLRV